ncbi:MAG: hypothetical protein OEY09_01125 [Gammaproteobacteria bacterium]|nr:hypothetical protein [Gammaproteobacteria bacterium]
MATAKKAAKTKKAAKKATKSEVKKKVAVKKKAAKPAVKKKVARVVKKKAAAKSVPSAAAKTKNLKDDIAALKSEIKTLKGDLKGAQKREAAMSKLIGQRDEAIAKFLNGWDKKAMAAMNQPAKARKKKKAKK